MHYIKLLSPILFLLLNLPVFAQAPHLFNYQGIARDAAGNPLSHQKISLQISILNTAEASEPEYSEIQTVVTNEFGLYNLQIGNGTVVTGNIKLISWETGNKYVKVSIDPAGGNNFVNAGTSQLLSVPYAIYSERSGSCKPASEHNTRTGAVNSNVTHVAGDANYMSKFTALNTIGKSMIFDNGTNIGIGTASPLSKLHLLTTTGNVEHIRMQNTNSTGFGKFLMHNDNASNYATFTKYGSAFPGGVSGIASQYPFANMLAFGNNVGPFMLSNNGNVGIAVITAGVTNMKFNANQTTGYLGLGGNALPAAKIHFNTATANDTIKFTNSATGHTASDGLEIRTNGTAASIINKENNTLSLGTFDTARLSILANGNIGVGTTSPTTKLDINGQIRIRGGAPFAGKVLTSDANGVGSWQFPGGTPDILPGTAKGNTPWWNDTIWVNSSNMLFNNGTKVGIGTNAPTALFTVKNRMQVDSNGSLKIGTGAILPNTSLSVNNKMMVDTNGTAKFVLSPGKAVLDISGTNDPINKVQVIKGGAVGQQGLYYTNDGFFGKTEFVIKDSLGFPYLYIADNISDAPEGIMYLSGNFYADSVFAQHIRATTSRVDDMTTDSFTVYNQQINIGYTQMSNLSDTANVPSLHVEGFSTFAHPKTNGFIKVVPGLSDATDMTGIVSLITPDTTLTKGVGILSEGNKVGLIANAYNSGTSALTHAIEANASNNGTCTGLFVKAKNRGVVSGTKNAIIAQATGGSVNNAGLFTGDLMVTGNLSKGGGTFKIDHPQDPENKFLIHSFVESPDMMNVYNGNIVSDANGVAVITLPAYFEAENKDFKYQLTVLDNSNDFVMVKVSKKISNNTFEIRTSKGNVEVSWQVTGIRKDKWAEAHRVVPEVEKEAKYKGSYWHPELYGKPAEEGILIQMGNEESTSSVR